MAIYREDIIDIDLANGNVFRTFMNKILSEGDAGAARFGARVLRNGAEVSLSGAACIGYFIRPDGVTLVLNGSISGSTAKVELPEAAFARCGKFTLTVKVSGGGVTSAVRIVDGSVVESTSADVYDPSSEIPDLSDYEEMVEEAEAATAIINALSVSSQQITGTRYKIAVTKEG